LHSELWVNILPRKLGAKKKGDAPFAVGIPDETRGELDFEAFSERPHEGVSNR